MQTYNYLSNELPRELIEVYNDLQSDLLRIIVKKLEQGEKPEKVYQYLKDKVDLYNPKIQKVLQIIFADAKKKNVKDNEREFEEAEDTAEPVTNNEANSLILPAILGGVGIITLLNKKIVNNAANKYTSGYSYINSKYGNKEVRKSQVITDLAKNGITIYESFGGGKSKNYSIENVLRRDVMYKVNQANAKINMENFNKSNAKFIQVSSHPTARTRTKYMKHDYEDHSSWQGKVYYSGEAVEGYKEFESTCGYGELLGICGINCYHQFMLSHTGNNTATKYSESKVKRNYELSQKQRQLERRVRQLKQEKSVYEEAGNTIKAKQVQSRLRNANAELKRFCEQNNLKYYNWRVQI